MMRDFPVEDEIDYDQYGAIHVCFSGSISENLMPVMVREPLFVSKVKTMIEVNIDFDVWMGNLFKVQSESNKMQELLVANKPTVERIAEQLLSVCSVLGEKPYLQY
mmetsp:Transcript_22920/g.22224  ORF Transcript_22920/g.22224 Transcript_22920/m.22224 type:complete len:106 (-) Transcript_22920:672-989(-)|eukprot:CAMPEP_0170553870 /NCGR_PEP_ID=MMETSP0211-20121228/11706_1 /TAXON_ID=311385 /ORGANISM="Pseudokeronopsis sp., Strain OXSARD2" /LENGTH=105 /DNA_ID=CAMNT_0010862493 /DNA_START=266 /DNA_END=583 /DNA_ORIENTATION=-